MPDLLKLLIAAIPWWMWVLLAMVFAWSIANAPWGARIKGWFGERVVSMGLGRLDPALYRVFHDLYLPRPDGRGTTQIDHVVVSPFGIFVIETKNYKGWIFGSEKQKQWTQTIYKRKHRFQNPLHQNALHIRALERFLGLDRGHLHSVVFFVGECEFKTELPGNVLNRGLRSYIEGRRERVFGEAEMERCLGRLRELDERLDRRRAGREHVRGRRSG